MGLSAPGEPEPLSAGGLARPAEMRPVPRAVAPRPCADGVPVFSAPTVLITAWDLALVSTRLCGPCPAIASLRAWIGNPMIHHIYISPDEFPAHPLRGNPISCIPAQRGTGYTPRGVSLIDITRPMLGNQSVSYVTPRTTRINRIRKLNGLSPRWLAFGWHWVIANHRSGHPKRLLRL